MRTECLGCGAPIEQSRMGPERVFCSSRCGMSHRWNTRRLDKTFRLQTLLAGAKNRSKSRNLEFNLTLSFLEELWERQQGNCVVTGRAFDLETPEKKGQPRPNAPSIDRIIPALGYTQGNVRLVTYHVNLALGEFGLSELRNLAKDILQTQMEAN